MDKTFIRRVVNAMDRQTDSSMVAALMTARPPLFWLCLAMSLVAGFRKGMVLLTETAAKLSQIPGCPKFLGGGEGIPGKEKV